MMDIPFAFSALYRCGLQDGEAHRARPAYQLNDRVYWRWLKKLDADCVLTWQRCVSVQLVCLSEIRVKIV